MGTVNVAKNAKKAGVSKYIMASSCSIYGASDGEPLDESSEKKRVSLYAKSKIDSENDIIKLSTDSFSVTFLSLAVSIKAFTKLSVFFFSIVLTFFSICVPFLRGAKIGLILCLSH